MAAFTARWPMQPRNPGGGGNEARQLQAWIAGPGEGGVAVVVLVNYGAGGGEGGFGTGSGGVRFVSISFGDLGIGRGMVGGAAGWLVRRVWGGGGSGGADHVDEGVWRERAECWLGEGESVMYRFTRVGD